MICNNVSRVEGVVASVLGSGRFSVDLVDGQSIRARASRRLNVLHARFAVGDRVLVGWIPPWTGRALIIADRKPAVAR